jgi:mRNA-degrading endonuclease RelE of RelBE toxin-antitoxin system
MEMIIYSSIPEFEKDLKKLKIRFPTLNEDLETAKRNTIELKYLHKKDNKSIFEIPGFCSEKLLICKIKKFACKSLKCRGNRSGIRIIYSFCVDSNCVEFIEIYFKGDKENEDFDRIKKYLKAAVLG